MFHRPMSSPMMTRMLGLAPVWALAGITPPDMPTSSAAAESRQLNLLLIIGFPPIARIGRETDPDGDAKHQGDRYSLRMDIDLKLLQYAVILAKHRHFGRAAAALRISQPTLSRNIAALEKQLGLRVFERSRRDVVATPAGDDVLKMADELVARAEAISNSLQMVRDGRGGRLRVAAGVYVHDIAVEPAAIDLINAHPSIRLELLEREWAAV